MRRTAYFIIAAALLSGCRVDKGEPFEPTRLGFDLARYTPDVLSGLCVSTQELLLFNDYLEAGEEQREEIHDRNFYHSRIVERGGGEWQIISSGRELTIRTGGKTLSVEGAEWQYYLADDTYVDGDFPSLRLTSAEDDGSAGYALHIPEPAQGYYRYGQCSGDITLTRTPYDITSGGKTEEHYSFTIAGTFSQYVNKSYFGAELCGVQVLEPLLYHPDEKYERGIVSGAISMTITSGGVSCSPEATFTGGGGVTVRGGEGNAYTKDYNMYDHYAYGYGHYYWD